MRTDNPDKGLLLIALLATTIAVLVAGLFLSVDSTDPLSAAMNFIQNGFTRPPQTGGNFLEGGETTEPIFIPPPPPPSQSFDETTGESPDVTDETLSPETTLPDPPETTENGTSAPNSGTSGTTKPPVTTKPPETTKPPVTTKPPETTKPPVTTTPPETSTPPVSDDEYFSNTLFIGDSRTAGFYLYAGIPKATYFGVTSMNVYNIFSTKSETGSTKDKDLVTVLSGKQYKQIYILLGVNEAWAATSNISSTYAKVIDSIKLYQPNAKIIIQSNMHVTKEKSDNQEKAGQPLTNKKIDAINKSISALADNKTVFYLSFEHIFDDASGALVSSYSGDGVHLKAKYYALWRDWIKQNGKIY